MAKFKGKLLVVKFVPTGGDYDDDAIDLTGSSRQFEYSGKAGKLDATTRDSVGKESLPDDAEYEASLNGLDTTGSPSWDGEDLQPGDTGTLYWFPEGEVLTKRKRNAPCNVTEVQYSSDHDGVPTWSIKWDLTAAPTFGTVSA